MSITESKDRWARAVEERWAEYLMGVWMAADLMNQGMEDFWRTETERHLLLEEVSEQLEVAPKTLRNYMAIARSYPPEGRLTPPLTIHHHGAVIKHPDRRALLTLAAERGWTVERLRLEASQGGNGEEMAEMPDILKVGGRFMRAGVRAKLSDKRLEFGFDDMTLVAKSASPITWEIGGVG